MDIKGVVFADLLANLANGFEEWQTLDVAHGAADFGDHHIGVVLAAHVINSFFNFIGNVRDDLNGTAKVIAPALFADDRPVDFPSRHIGAFGKININKTFVMSKVEIGFPSIIGDKHFTVLVGTHRTWIKIDVWIKFLDGDFHAPAFQQAPQRSRRDSFAQRRYHPTGNKYILGHMRLPPLLCITHSAPARRCRFGTWFQLHQAAEFPAVWSAGFLPFRPAQQRKNLPSGQRCAAAAPTRSTPRTPCP